MENLELIFAIFLVSTNEWAFYTFSVESFFIINWGIEVGTSLEKVGQSRYSLVWVTVANANCFNIAVRYHNSNTSLIIITIYTQSCPLLCVKCGRISDVHNKEGSKFMELANR